MKCFIRRDGNCSFLLEKGSLFRWFSVSVVGFVFMRNDMCRVINCLSVP